MRVIGWSTVKNAGMILLASVIAGTILMCLVYLLPVSGMQEHVRESVDRFLEEGDNPFLMEGYKGSSLDNATDAVMLGNAVNRSEKSVFEAAMLAERGDNLDEEAQEDLRSYLEGDVMDQASAYARYWHGYLLVLKPLLLFLNYYQIRYVNGFTSLVLLICVLVELYKKNMKKGMAAFLFSMASLFPMAIPWSLQFSTAYYVGMLGCFALLKKYVWLDHKDRWIYFYLVLGICTSFFDFLTYPLFTFGMPLIIQIVISRPDLKRGLTKTIYVGISWCTGYLGMWAGKWVVGSILTKTNILLDAAGAVENRISSVAYDETVSRISSVLRNASVYYNIYGICLAIIILGWIGYYLFKHKKNMDRSGVILMMGIACLPVIWYACIVNHSFSHYWFTFRAISVSVFAVGMIPEICSKK